MSSPKFTVAISGGGIAGLSTAIAISHFCTPNDIGIDIYEAAQEFTEIGAGLGLWSRPLHALKRLGLEEDLAKISRNKDPIDSLDEPLRLRKADQPIGVNFFDITPTMGVTTFHRPQFLNCLASNLPKDSMTVHFGKRMTAYSEHAEGKIVLEFKDGSTAICDLLIGADGVHSATRHAMLELAAKELQDAQDLNGAAALREKIEPMWSGMAAYRTVTSSEKLRKLNPNHRTLTDSMMYIGKGRQVVAYPIAGGTLVNIAAAITRPEVTGTKYEGKLVEERTKEELLKEYEGWEDEVTQLLQCAVERPSCWIVTVLNELPIYTHNHVVLVGDAAHAMTPNQGTGAGQAVEDAYILGSILAHPSVTPATLRLALEVYQQVRLPHANKAQRDSLALSKLHTFQDPRFAHFDAPDGKKTKVCLGEDVGKLWELGYTIAGVLRWNWTTSVEDDRLRAMDILEEKLGGQQGPGS